MSDFFRVRAPAEFVEKTTRELARLAHQAEDTGDDILLMQVQDEVSRRERTYPARGLANLFREHYLDLHRPEHRKTKP